MMCFELCRVLAIFFRNTFLKCILRVQRNEQQKELFPSPAPLPPFSLLHSPSPSSSFPYWHKNRCTGMKHAPFLGATACSAPSFGGAAFLPLHWVVLFFSLLPCGFVQFFFIKKFCGDFMVVTTQVVKNSH